MDKAVVTCALTGVLTDPAVYPAPVTPEEMAREAKRAVDEGASVVHVHFRRQEPGLGHRPSWDPKVATAVIAAIRDACPDVIINQTTGVVGDDITGPLQCLHAVKPEIAALNAGSLNYLKTRADGTWAWPPILFDNPVDKIRKFMGAMLWQSILPEFECFDFGMVRTAAAIARNCGDERPPKYNFVMGVESGMPAEPDLLPFLLRHIVPGRALERDRDRPRGNLAVAPARRRNSAAICAPASKTRSTCRTARARLRTAISSRRSWRSARETGRDIASPEEARFALGLFAAETGGAFMTAHAFDTVRMSPFYTPEHEAFRQSLRQFVAREIEPYANDWDEAGEFPRELYRKAAAVGYMGLGFPEAYGGTEGDRFMRIIAMQEIARAGCGGVAAGLFTHTIGAPPILHRGSEAMKARVLPQILSGEKISALAITEPSGGSDVANLRTTARREGDHFVVNGSKTFITSGMRADFITLAARTGGAGASGVSLLLIEGQPEGLQRTSLKKMGWWCSDTATLYFENVRVPVENLIGEEGEGFRAIMLNFNDERLHGAAGAISAARVCLEEAIAWAKERVTFGKPIIQHQVIRHKLVDMAMRIEASPGDARTAHLAAGAGRESGRRDLHAEEPGDDDARLLRLGRRADLRRRRLHARRQGRAHLSRGEGQRDRRRHRGNHEGPRQPADGVLGVTSSSRAKRSDPGAEERRLQPWIAASLSLLAMTPIEPKPGRRQ